MSAGSATCSGAILAVAALLGILAALVGIAIMRGVTLCEDLLAKARIWPPLRPALGGLAVGLLALITPQVMSSGHGALHFAGFVTILVTVIATMFVLKAIASVVSLGSGFRGGLFFATLFLGALGGHLFAVGFGMVWPGLNLDPNVYAVIGMSALSASVVGGPLTMTFIALGIHRQSLAHHRRAGLGHHLDPDHPRTVRRLVRHLANAPARRNHPQRRRCGLDPRSHGAEPDAARRRHRQCRHDDRRIPRHLSAGIEDPGGGGRRQRPLRRARRSSPKRTRRISIRRRRSSRSFIIATSCCIPR